MLNVRFVISIAFNSPLCYRRCIRTSCVDTMNPRRSTRTKTSTLTSVTNGKSNGDPESTSRAPPTSRKRASTASQDVGKIKKPKKSAKGTDSIAPLAEPNGFKVPSLPSTPNRRTQRATKPPAVTPTPSLVGIIAPYSSGDIDDATPPPLDRPVEPHRTNATLTTPSGTQYTTYPLTFPESSPSKTGLPRPTATTGTLLDQALAHLRNVDSRIIPVIEQHHCHLFSPAGLAEEIDPFRSLASGIMAQQVSGAAARSIKNKFIALFHDGKGVDDPAIFPTPAQVAQTDIPRLRLAGLSERKAEYIQGLAQKFVSGELSTEMLLRATDEEIMEKLTAVRGLGRWSVEMFACFGLKRMDVFSTGDLGVQRGMAAFVGRDVSRLKAKGGGKWKYMSEKEMVEVAEAFRPYRSLFMWYMWLVPLTIRGISITRLLHHR